MDVESEKGSQGAVLFEAPRLLRSASFIKSINRHDEELHNGHKVVCLQVGNPISSKTAASALCHASSSFGLEGGITVPAGRQKLRAEATQERCVNIDSSILATLSCG